MMFTDSINVVKTKTTNSFLLFYFRNRPFHFSAAILSAGLGLIIGTFTMNFRIGTWLANYHQIVSGLAFSFAIFSIILKRFGRIFCAFLTGFLLASIRFNSVFSSEIVLSDFANKTVEISAVVQNDPVLKNKSWRFESSEVFLDNFKLDGTVYFSIPTPSSSGAFDANASSDAPTFSDAASTSDIITPFSRSDKLRLRGKFQSGFGKYIAYVSKADLIEISKPSPPDFSLILRDIFTENLRKLFGVENHNELALGLGYLTGQKTLISDEENEKLRKVGLAHVVVASGFHLSTIVGLAKKFLMRISRFACLVGSILLILAFISVTGLSASMLRAGLITGLNLWAWYFGRRFHPARILVYVMTFSLLIQPAFLRDTAWQLSFASFAGLMLFSPVLTKLLYGEEEPGFLANTLIQTISAQLCCLPVSIYTFGNISVMGLFSGLLIPFTIPIAMLLCFITGLYLPFVSVFVAWLARSLLWGHLEIINFLSSFSWGSLELKSENPWIFMLYIPIAISFLVLKKLSRHDFRPLLAPLENSENYGRIYSC